MVVAGRSAFVGSDEATAEHEASRFENQPARARLGLTATVSGRAKISVTVEPIQASTGDFHVMLALFENDLATECWRGERGPALKSDFVVRRLIDWANCCRAKKSFAESSMSPGTRIGRRSQRRRRLSSGHAIWAVYDAARSILWGPD